MKPVPAIVEPAQVDVDLIAEQVIVALTDLRSAENRITRLEGQIANARETDRIRRYEIGQLLVKARMAWPMSGPKSRGWGEFLSRVKLDDTTAWRYMELVKRSSGSLHGEGKLEGDRERAPSYGDVGLTTNRDRDRDTWCTPKWITDAIGEFDLDPCANERSHVAASTQFQLSRGEDGLERASGIGHDWRVFVNPPYSDVMPWIKAYAHTRFCFLLKLDPSTRWFAELYARTELILMPRGTRIEFEAPAGVVSSSNPFPHALFYARAYDAAPAIGTLCFPWRVEQVSW